MADSFKNVSSKSLKAEKQVSLKTLKASIKRAIFKVLLATEPSDFIPLTDLALCIERLSNSNLELQVKLLFNFMDEDGSGNISVDEAKAMIRYKSSHILRVLGMDDKNLESKIQVTYADVLDMFQSSTGGLEAISLFSSHILKLLSKLKEKHLNPSSRSMRRLSRKLTKEVYRILSIDVFTRVKVLFTVLQIFLWVYYFVWHLTNGYPVTVAVAKGFGFNLRILTIFIFATMARTTLGVFYSFKFLQPIIPIGISVSVHSFLGFCIAFHTIGHVVAHAINASIVLNQSFETYETHPAVITRDGWTATPSDFTSRNVHDWPNGDVYTGLVLVAVITVMSITAALRSLGSNGFKLFAGCHYLHSVWLCFNILHCPGFWPYFLPIVFVMFVERSYDRIFRTCVSTMTRCRPCKNGTTFISVDIPSHMQLRAGTYYRIKVPAISVWEWHPFSLAGGVSSNHVCFFVASVGDWTRRLHQIVAEAAPGKPPLRDSITILIQGPFMAPAASADLALNSRTLLVASGIGITPFLSIIATAVAEDEVAEADRKMFGVLFSAEGADSGVKSKDKEPLTVLWSVRDPGELRFYLDYVYELVHRYKSNSNRLVNVFVHMTGLGSSDDPIALVNQVFYLLTLAEKTDGYIKISFGRPLMEKFIPSIQPNQVFFCGGGPLQTITHDVCKKLKVPLHCEEFDSGKGLLPTAFAKLQRGYQNIRPTAAKNTEASPSDTVAITGNVAIVGGQI